MVLEDANTSASKYSFSKLNGNHDHLIQMEDILLNAYLHHPCTQKTTSAC